MGNRPEENDALNIFVTGPASSGANSFQMRLGMPSGPMVLQGFNLDSFPHSINVKTINVYTYMASAYCVNGNKTQKLMSVTTLMSACSYNTDPRVKIVRIFETKNRTNLCLSKKIIGFLFLTYRTGYK